MGVVKKINKLRSYHKFTKIDGSHPLKKIIPNGYVDYKVRFRHGGIVKYFNFDLAREMGLIGSSHLNQMTSELEEKILDTFSIQIINEFDIINNKVFPESEIKPGKYMATRYLQLQHDDKKGKKSGDGRSIWNGQINHKGKSWDISSCGTGATKLSPATSKYNKFFESGDPAISYGCGYAEIDEGLGTSLMSKVFHNNNIATERNLCVIEFENNLAINVRAHQNLLRPSHFFIHLKQDNLDSLTSLTDYYIDCRVNAGDWNIVSSASSKYDLFLNEISKTFAEMCAKFEDEYIFCWLDWDGDNILMDGSIIDYGSIRQFGALHCEYRYDDVERFSTSILEQKSKAKYIVKTFIQAIEYIKTGVKPSMSSLNNHKILKSFETQFNTNKNLNLLHKIGLTERKSKQILKRNPNIVNQFRKVFSYFERAKSSTGIVKVSDGVTCDAIFNMRSFLREFPQLYMCLNETLAPFEFIELIKTQYALNEDLEVNSYRKKKIENIQIIYIKIINEVAKLFQICKQELLLELVERSAVINKPSRITGDSVTHIVQEISKSNLKQTELFELITWISKNQNLKPDSIEKICVDHSKPTFDRIMQLIYDFREGI